MGNLHKELSYRAKLLMDDNAFLREVGEGRSAASPDMNPARELEHLKLRFVRFQKEFKVSQVSFNLPGGPPGIKLRQLR